MLFEINGFNFREDDSKRCALQNSLCDIRRNQYQEHIPLAHTTEDHPSLANSRGNYLTVAVCGIHILVIYQTYIKVRINIGI